MLRKNYVLGVGVTNETEDEILEYLLLSLKHNERKYYIVTPNPEIVVAAQDNPRYKKILNEAKIALPDGIGVFLGSALMGHTLRERITGVDFMEEVCKRSSERPLRLGFLGGRGGVAEMTAECLKGKYPWIDVVFVGEEWSKEVSSMKYLVSSIQNTKYQIPNTKIDILFVAFGHPKQEEWINENLEHLPVKVAMGVGGAFDYISGRVKRAPFMVRAIGMEWLYRLIREPWRWRRQMALGKFAWLVIKERCHFLPNP
jgi:N-acetylglucosaminyldiphosphoundecaprenol N-acetyl-beta-D-mannosaminyltransferase